ncbi:MAG: sigma-70 family RNA polymerase sigma factor [Actinobacteria bacterium]|nr:sigma-70 family RNA polymerase sigma factor [Actinomycetota bacterium]
MREHRGTPIEAAPSGGGADSERVPTWEEVAQDHGRFLYTVAYRLTGNHEEAQDLVQDVLLRVRRGLATYRPGSMEGWLSRITTNAFLDDVRRKKRRPTDPLPDDPERIVAGALSAEDALDAAGLPDHIQAALRQLPEDFRVAVVLCDVLGFSYTDIAEALDVPVGTVRSRIHRGRTLLREALL